MMPFRLARPFFAGLVATALALWGDPSVAVGSRVVLAGGSQNQVGGASAAEAPRGKALLDAVRATLQKERKDLLEYAYRERRRPLKVSPLGKVSLGAVQEFDVLPSADPDRPHRVLVTIDGRPATRAERDEYARRQGQRSRESAEERQRHDAETRRRAQQRFEDAFRVYQFEPEALEMVDGALLRVVRVTPRAGVETRSDVGKWLNKFKGRAWIAEEQAQLVRLQLTATDSISLGWGVVGRIAEGTTVTFTRRPTREGVWFPATLRFEARGRTLLFRAFEVDTTTEWFGYRPNAPTPVAARP